MKHKRIVILIGAGVAAAGLGAGLAAAVSSSPGTTQKATSAAAVSAVPPYSYYQSMMGRYFGRPGSMMDGSGGYGWMMGTAGYRWMFGGTTAPAWMRGAHLPAAMMGARSDMGQIMGRLWAGAPGPRVSPGQAAALGAETPAGAVVSRSANTITFASGTVSLAVVASPSSGPDETFRIAGLVNPDIIVPAGARVTMQVINADPDTAHGLVITSPAGPATSWMPMMTDRLAFTGSALWLLGNPTSAGMHTGTLAFTAAAGSYRYLCPVPGHAQKGMTGQFIVTAS